MRKIAVITAGTVMSAVFLVLLSGCGSGSFFNGVPAHGCGAAALTPTVKPQPPGFNLALLLIPQDSPTPLLVGTFSPPPTPGPCFGVPAIVAPLTPAKVIDYVSSHPLQRNMATAQISSIKVQEFAAADAPVLLQGDSVVSDGTNIWYAELQGQFSFGGPAGSDNASNYSYGFEVFDDLSGNLLASGGRESPVCDYSNTSNVCQPVVPITPVATATS